MAKVVYNNCYGGFSLSREAVLLGRKLSNDPKWGGPCIIGDFFDSKTPVERDYGHCDDLSRSDPILVAVVEQLGKKANGDCASLAIEIIPSGMFYRIDEYDGNERVMTQNDYKWDVA